ncbi:MAG: hypothetical protein ACOCXA_02095 [Planctomycetota bacterium]
MDHEQAGTDILIIHGIGDQQVYSTLDRFCRGLAAAREHGGHRVRFRHGFQARASGAEAWIDHHIAIDSDRQDRLRCHEYYWAHLPQRRMDWAGLYAWMRRVAAAARRHYPRLAQVVRRYGRADPGVQTGPLSFGRHLRWLSPALAVLDLIRLPRIPWIGGIINHLVGRGQRIILQVIGDLAVYTNSDLRDEHYRVRRAILDGAVERLRTILMDTTTTRVVVVGHSLGSVVGYDAINRLLLLAHVDVELRAALPKLQGFITFGSPLDKMALFFRYHSADDQILRQQLLAHHHRFKARSMILATPDQPLEDPFEADLDRHIRWTNLYSSDDPVSGRLDFYDCDENVACDLRRALGHTRGRWGIAHRHWWDYEPLYAHVLACCDKTGATDTGSGTPRMDTSIPEKAVHS